MVISLYIIHHERRSHAASTALDMWMLSINNTSTLINAHVTSQLPRHVYPEFQTQQLLFWYFKTLFRVSNGDKNVENVIFCVRSMQLLTHRHLPDDTTTINQLVSFWTWASVHYRNVAWSNSRHFADDISQGITLEYISFSLIQISLQLS